RIHDRYADFASYYDILIVPARPSKPKDKASVERAVQTAYSLILGYFDGVVFYSLDELNDAIAERIADINDNLIRPDGMTRRELFAADEAPLMRDLPHLPFTEVAWKHAKVDRNWHITCDYQYYSVPFKLIGKTLRRSSPTEWCFWLSLKQHSVGLDQWPVKDYELLRLLHCRV
ncbi:Mu transposase domain-containing protein, partial [Corynebacterium casei]|uniref:Mu transposase domain-containing protein n=1 Tax=Corynebacterium casei TaxID=160386 RepID=UPI003FD3B9FF